MKRTRSATSRILLPTLALLLSVGGFVGCDAEEAPSSDRLAVTDAGSEGAAARPRPPRSLVAALVRAAADTDAIDGDERPSLEALSATVADMHDERHQAEAGLREAVALGTKTCSFDVTDALATLESLAKEHGAVDEELLDSLHEMLTDDQRAAIADAVLEHRQRGPGNEPSQDRRLRQDDAELEADGSPRAEGDGPGRPPSQMRRLVEELSLSESQLVALEDARPEPQGPAEKSEELEVLLDAFRTSAFTAADFDLPSRASQHAVEHAGRWVSGVTTLCGILDDEQRVTLAAVLETPPRR